MARVKTHYEQAEEPDPADARPSAGAAQQSEEEIPDWLLPRKVELLSSQLPSLQVAGMICRGDKVMIQGGSKSRKTWFNLQKIYCIANGLDFIGFKTYKTKSLAVDLELREGFLRKRLEKIREALGQGDFRFLEVIPLRGHAADLSALRLMQLSGIIREGGFGFFTIDPIYKLFRGKDENSNADVAALLAPFDKITAEADTTFNCTHHFAKGNAAAKEAIDRGAGAGTFQRSPDVIITMSPLKEKDCYSIEIIQSPDWNHEPDYHEREKTRLDLIAKIRAHATRYSQTETVCPGCDTRIWEADVAGTVWRGCHCMTLMLASNDPLSMTPIDLAAWQERVNQGNVVLASNYRQKAARNPQLTKQTPLPTERKFGPFLVPEDALDQINPAGFKCLDCQQPVERMAMVVPEMVPRLVLYACQCGAVQVWEDESQPEDSKHWKWNMKMLRAAKSDLLVFNGNKPLQPDFSGPN